MARDLWLRQPIRVSAAAPGLQVKIDPHRITTYYFFKRLREFTDVFSCFGDGEGALTYPLVHTAETSCALTPLCRNAVCVAEMQHIKHRAQPYFNAYGIDFAGLHKYR